MTLFVGNAGIKPGSDKRYHLRYKRGALVIQADYITDEGIFELDVLGQHDALISALEAIRPGGGSFRITEHHNIILPVTEHGITTHHTVGKYSLPIRFDFEGRILSGEAVSPDGEILEPGNLWLGIKAGVRYVLSADRNDVYYERPINNGIRKERLSDELGRNTARVIAKCIAGIKGPGGGFYVNEFQEIFGPPAGQADPFLYFGKIDFHNWFPDPHPDNTIIG